MKKMYETVDLQVETPETVTSLSSTRAANQVPRVAVIMTCFNRKQKTLECLHALAANTGLEHVQVSVFLTDDGSTDGTAQAVQLSFPWVQVLLGDGNLFWCRGMHKSFQVALRDEYDYYLWLNDDTILKPDSLTRLMQFAAVQSHPVITVGSTVDPDTGQLTYGGVIRSSKLRPVNFRFLMPDHRPQRCDSMTGNIVLIPASVARLVGNLDPVFEHAMGDTDYALRAGKLGIETWLAPGIFGSCSENPSAGTFVDRSEPLAYRWRQMMSRKGLPWRSWLTLTRRHAGCLWILYFAWPYMKLFINNYPADPCRNKR